MAYESDCRPRQCGPVHSFPTAQAVEVRLGQFCNAVATASATPLAHSYPHAPQPVRLDPTAGVAAVMARGVPTQALPPWARCAGDAGLPHSCMPPVNARPCVLQMHSCPVVSGRAFAQSLDSQTRRAILASSVARTPAPAGRLVACAMPRVHSEPRAPRERRRASPPCADKEPCAKPSSEALRLLHLPKPQESAAGECRVRLMLTVSSGGVGCTPPGTPAIDCGVCQYCLDKPKFGGPGSKRKRCVARRCLEPGPARVWSSLRVVTVQYLRELEAYASQDPPPELIEARAKGPIPLVWGFRRAPRARPLPPAYVLMYHCERHVELDRSTLPVSLSEQWQGKGCRRGPRGRDSEGGLLQHGGSGGGAGVPHEARRPSDYWCGERTADPAGATSSAAGSVATGSRQSDAETGDAGGERVDDAAVGHSGAEAGGEAGSSEDEQTSESEAGRETDDEDTIDRENDGEPEPFPTKEAELQASGARTLARWL
jgi:hypothetical protein